MGIRNQDTTENDLIPVEDLDALFRRTARIEREFDGLKKDIDLLERYSACALDSVHPSSVRHYAYLYALLSAQYRLDEVLRQLIERLEEANLPNIPYLALAIRRIARG